MIYGANLYFKDFDGLESLHYPHFLVLSISLEVAACESFQPVAERGK